MASQGRKNLKKTYVVKNTKLICEWHQHSQGFYWVDWFLPIEISWPAFTPTSQDSPEGLRMPRSYIDSSSLSFQFLWIYLYMTGWPINHFPEYCLFSLMRTYRKSPFMVIFPFQVHAEGVKQTFPCLCHPVIYKRKVLITLEKLAEQFIFFC